MEKSYRDRFEETLIFDHDEVLNVRFEENSSGALRLFLDEGCQKLDIRFDAGEYSYTKVFIQVRSAKENTLNVRADCQQDAKIRMGFLDLDHGVENLEILSDLKRPGATFDIYTGQLCKTDAKKIGHIKISHLEPFTYGNIHNFAVCMEKGYYDMVADGTIRKGAHDSESHQETRVLTLGTGHYTRVLPLLYIDENEVKASHALTIGQPDESQLYYIQSRGLTKEQAIGLLSIGYFMPVIDLVDNEADHDALRKELESKMGLYEY